MGVGKHLFLKLQNKVRMRISMSLLANKSAQRTLEPHVRSYDWERMRTSGVQLTREPSARSLLLLRNYTIAKITKNSLWPFNTIDIIA
jgi:hypothetical protein